MAGDRAEPAGADGPAGRLTRPAEDGCTVVTPWHVYIVRCADGTVYTGITNDVIRRVTRHNEGKGGRYTRGRSPRRRCGSNTSGPGDGSLRRGLPVVPQRDLGEDEHLVDPGLGRGLAHVGLDAEREVPAARVEQPATEEVLEPGALLESLLESVHAGERDRHGGDGADVQAQHDPVADRVAERAPVRLGHREAEAREQPDHLVRRERQREPRVEGVLHRLGQESLRGQGPLVDAVLDGGRCVQLVPGRERVVEEDPEVHPVVPPQAPQHPGPDRVPDVRPDDQRGSGVDAAERVAAEGQPEPEVLDGGQLEVEPLLDGGRLVVRGAAVAVVHGEPRIAESGHGREMGRRERVRDVLGRQEGVPVEAAPAVGRRAVLGHHDAREEDAKNQDRCTHPPLHHGFPPCPRSPRARIR
ncbi:MAG: GIY-YIG nuclease family protein [Deltaproteobacteria bacterium]|nr:GIY-YIG nuclease family protein [Deltaproteobacteria bacterium]